MCRYIACVGVKFGIYICISEVLLEQPAFKIPQDEAECYLAAPTNMSEIYLRIS